MTDPNIIPLPRFIAARALAAFKDMAAGSAAGSLKDEARELAQAFSEALNTAPDNIYEPAARSVEPAANDHAKSPPAPRRANVQSRFACWSEDLSEDGEVKIVKAHGHENAAACYMMKECAGISAHTNPPSADTILVIDLESGESRFVMMRLTVHIVDNYATATQRDESSS